MRATPINAQCVVNDVVTRFPPTSRVFSYFGVDVCGAGASTIHQAAVDEFIDEEVLIDSLCSAVRYSEGVAAAR